MTSMLSAEDANTFLAGAFGKRDGGSEVIHMSKDKAIVRLEVKETDLRPGGYVSGPTQMSMADTAAYFAVMTRIGLEPMTVTSNLNINFLRPCIGKIVLAEGRLMKIGKALAVIEVDIRIEGADKPSSHAIVTYAIPRSSEGGQA